MCENVGQRCACRLAMWFGRNPMPELERLSLARNNLTVLPALDLPSLKVLDLSYNKLREISSAATLAALEEVNLEGNVRLADKRRRRPG
ncbi:hypothetical protein CTAYLR_003274 [Chrysophaeum taylorii]|uniref:Uncharacterized protein n=1 Tax=Chrysophaeum taylorii TaxID=2483200 RepID=A0AAD7UBB0_9STRA|nr:hypothetical protein CTAYLR_003274 [Chrysophaeum taylorii]